MELTAASKRVLVVDDNEEAASLVADILSLAGHCARFTTNGDEGLKLALADRPSVMFIDIEMPGMDGFELATRLRGEGLQIRLVALTVWGDPKTVRRASECGFDQHLVKPAKIEDILLAVESRSSEDGAARA